MKYVLYTFKYINQQDTEGIKNALKSFEDVSVRQIIDESLQYHKKLCNKNNDDLSETYYSDTDDYDEEGIRKWNDNTIETNEIHTPSTNEDINSTTSKNSRTLSFSYEIDENGNFPF